ncbi:MAG TPA: pyruvate kinase [Anaerolineales bacterium]|nr:pyruvate kinase [Anaerolineales bacterium]
MAILSDRQKQPLSERYARIVATIGPASQDQAKLLQLIKAGMDVARLNFSHGTHDYHLETIKNLRAASAEAKKPVTILQDLQGPKIRTGELENGAVQLKAGDRLFLTSSKLTGNQGIVSVDFPRLTEAVKPGGRILLDDGNLELVVVSVSHEKVETQVVLGGTLLPHKGVNLPRAHLDISPVTEKDLEDLAFGLKHGVDAVALSFVRSPKDINDLRKVIQTLAEAGDNVPVIAKLERPEALDALDSIVIAADGVMVARGDLGVEMAPETVPIAQKTIIDCANKHARLVITATQMLDSMIHNPRPTRAEASDVANAIFDGSDAVMLSGETAAGKYPVQAVETMDAIIRQAEAKTSEWGHWRGLDVNDFVANDTYYITRGARELACDRDVSAIAIFSKTGRSALMMSKNRPQVPIFGFTPVESTYHRMNLLWGVTPFLVKNVDSLEDMLKEIDITFADSGMVQPGQQVVMVCGYPVSEQRPANLALLYTVGQNLRFP